MSSLTPVILSGGIGSRLWPLSREQYPKQLQPLMTDNSLLQDTALRVAPGVTDGVTNPIVVCNDAHRFIVGEQLSQVGITPKRLVIEPFGRNTAPAAAAAALLLKDDPDALMLILPSDHVVKNPQAFLEAITQARPAAEAGQLVTFGITPTAPLSSYGYIRRGAAEGAVFAVDAFVEKPSRETAETYLSTGAYYWNGGIFLMKAAVFLQELAQFEPAIGPGCQAALDAGSEDLDFFRLDSTTFDAVPSQSIDYGVMERTSKAAVIPVDMGWSDVGSWGALHEEMDQDVDGNSAAGDVVLIGAKNTYVRSERQLTAALGVEDLVVVVTDDAVLVADKAHDQEVKKIVEGLKAQARPEAEHMARVYRPWGWYQTIDEGPRFKTKRLMVKPGGRLSLQRHKQRAEHWVVVAGTARVTHGDTELDLGPNRSMYIPAGTVHRLENPFEEDVHIIEVQTGAYVGEDDIERLDDVYGREGEVPAATD